MPASKASRFFELADQREVAFCQSINRAVQFRPALGYFRLVSRLGDGWFWYALILTTPFLWPTEGPALALLMTLTGLTCTLIPHPRSRFTPKSRACLRPLATY